MGKQIKSYMYRVMWVDSQENHTVHFERVEDVWPFVELLRARSVSPYVERLIHHTEIEEASERFLRNDPIPCTKHSHSLEDMYAVENEFPLKISLCWRCPLQKRDSRSWAPLYEEDGGRRLVTGYWIDCPAKDSTSRTVHSYELPPDGCPLVTEHAVREKV